MPKVIRIAMNGVGVPEARFLGYLADLSCKDGKPSNAVLKRLMNGGGKTSGIKLITAVFEPNTSRLDRSQRFLKDLFTEQMGIVALEMTVDGAHPDLFGENEPRQVLGYAARQMRADKFNDKGDKGIVLDRLWFHFLCTTAVDLEQLPIRRDDERTTRLAPFKAKLQELDAANPGMELALFEKQEDWKAHIEQALRIDIASSIHFMLTLNTQESGATTDILKKFQRDEDFLEFLLNPIIGSESDEGLTTTIGQTLRSQANLDEQRSRRDFFQASVGRLQPLAVAAQGKRECEERLATTVDGYRGVVGKILGRQIALADLIARDIAEIETATSHLANLKGKETTLRSEQNWIALRQLELVAEAAEAAAADARKEANEAEAALEHGEANIAACELYDLTLQIEDLRQQIEAKNRPLTEARAKLKQIGGRAAMMLDARVTSTSEAARKAEARWRELVEEGRNIAAKHATATSALKECRRRAGEVREQFAKQRKQFEKLIAAGHIGLGEDPAEVASAARRLEQMAETVFDQAGERRSECSRTDQDARQAAATATQDLSDALAATVEADEALTAYRRQRARIRGLSTLRLRFGENADPYGPGIINDLLDRRDEVRAEASKASEAAAELRRIAEAIDCHKLLPPPDEIAQTVDSLKAAGLSAHWMPLWLVENQWTPERIRAAIEADPARFSGVVVLGAGIAECHDAATALSSRSTFRVPVCVVAVDGGEPVPVFGLNTVVVAPSPATYDVEAARHEATALVERAEKLETKSLQLIAEADLLRADADVLADFLRTYPAGWEAIAESALDNARCDEESKTKTLELKEREVRTAAAALVEAEAALELRKAELRKARERVQALAVYQAQWGDRIAELAETLEEATCQEGEHLGEIRSLEVRREQNDVEMRSAETDRAEADRLAAATVRRREAIVEVDDTPPRLEDTVDELEAAYARQDELVRQMDRGNDLSVRRDLLDQERIKKSLSYREKYPRHQYPDMVQEIKKSGRVYPADIPAMRARQTESLKGLGSAVAVAKTAQEDVRRKRTVVEKEMLEPAGAAELTDEATCETAFLAWKLRLTKILTDIDAARQRLSDAETAKAGHDKESEWLESAVRNAKTAHGVKDRGFPAADPAGADMTAKVLVEEELALRSKVSDGAGELTARKDEVQAAATQYRRFLDANAKKKACEEIIAVLNGWTAADLENKTDELLERYRDLAAGLTAKIDAAEKELARCEAVIRGYFDRVYERVLVVERLSIMPDGLGEWSGKPFVRIHRSDNKIAIAEHVRSRIRQWLNEAVAAQGNPDAKRSIPSEHAPLLKQIVVSVLSGKIFFETIRVRTDWRVEYKPVTDLKVYSGGEKLMATLLLYFLSVRIGMETRKANRDASMFILLDNPVGEMNALQLVRPALEMAQKANIQVIGWTGLNDMSVLKLFPLVVNLRRRSAASRVFVTVDSVMRTDVDEADPRDTVEMTRLGWMAR